MILGGVAASVWMILSSSGPPGDSEAEWRIDGRDRQVDIHFARIWGTRGSRNGQGGLSLVFVIVLSGGKGDRLVHRWQVHAHGRR